MFTELGPALACLEISSVASGYAVFNELSQKETIRVIEASPVGYGKFMILLTGDKSVLRIKYQEALSKKGVVYVAHAFLEQFDPRILEAFYGLSKTQATGSVLVVEFANVAGALVAAQMALSKTKIQLLDLKAGRASGARALLFFCGDLRECESARRIIAEGIDASNSLEGIELLSHPSAAVLKHFSH